MRQRSRALANSLCYERVYLLVQHRLLEVEMEVRQAAAEGEEAPAVLYLVPSQVVEVEAEERPWRADCECLRLKKGSHRDCGAVERQIEEWSRGLMY